MALYDSHTHLDDSRFAEDQNLVIERALAAGVTGMINIGSDMASSQKSLELAQKYPMIYAAIGVHPHEAKSVMESDYDTLLEWAKQDKVLAIGEIGLDYYYDNSPREIQQQVFRRQLLLAKAAKLPIIVHTRDAHGDMMAALKAEGQGLTGIIHCYSGSLEMAKELIKKGYYLGIGGALTFKNGRKLKEIVAAVPLEALVVETDCPYLTPHPYRGQRNEPSYVNYVVDEIAAIRAIDRSEVMAVTTNNLQNLFGIA